MGQGCVIALPEILRNFMGQGCVIALPEILFTSFVFLYQHSGHTIS
jgi:hypothetical protein